MSGRAVQVVIVGDLHEIVLLPDETIFAGAHRLGLAPPFSCIAGYCGACTVEVEEGEVEMRVNRALSEKQLARGLVLACQAVPKAGGCRVRFLEGPRG